MNDRITIILGAGVMIEATGVSTKLLTDEVLKGTKEFKLNEISELSLVQSIYQDGNRFYYDNLENIGKDNYAIMNFEDIFHHIELLPNYLHSFGFKERTSAYRIFSEPLEKYKFLKNEESYGCLRKII